jgi:uncharacterized membrane protein
MTPVLVVSFAWLLFGATHLLLAWPPLRDRLVRRLGERGHALLYTAVAASTLTLLAAAVARHAGEGPPGPALSDVPWARGLLAAVAFAGAALAAAGLANYFRSPIAILRRAAGRPVTLRAPSAVERITRHPFFIGLALTMGAHALLARTLSSAVFFGGFVVLVLAGIPMQDSKLRARHGALYAGYLGATSAVPTLRGPIAWRDAVTPALVALAVTAVHPLWKIGGGAPFAVLVALGGLYAVARQVRVRAARR